MRDQRADALADVLVNYSTNVEKGDVVAVAFHPELTPDPRLHRLLLDVVAGGGVREAA